MSRTKFNAEAEVGVLLRSRKQLNAIKAALTPETLRPAREKAQARITVHGQVLKIRFRAHDSSSLRAIMSSYLRMLRATASVCAVLLELDQPLIRSSEVVKESRVVHIE